MKGQKGNLAKWTCLLLLVVAVLCLEDSAQRKVAYMARAVLLEQQMDGYVVGVLYQAPEASANSAEVQAPFTLLWAKNASVAGAFQDIAQQSQQKISYQQSDDLLLCGQCGQAALAGYAQRVQTEGHGRYAAKVSVLAQGVATIAERFNDNQAAAQSLIELLAQDAQQAPRLYQVGWGSIVMPWYSIDDTGNVQPEKLFYELHAAGGQHYNDAQSQLYLLLSGRAPCTFVLGEDTFTVGYRVHSWAAPLQGVCDGTRYSQMMHTKTTKNAVRIDALVAGVVSATNKVEFACYLQQLCAENPMVLRALDIETVSVVLYSFSPLVG